MLTSSSSSTSANSNNNKAYQFYELHYPNSNGFYVGYTTKTLQEELVVYKNNAQFCDPHDFRITKVIHHIRKHDLSILQIRELQGFSLMTEESALVRLNQIFEIYKSRKIV